MQNPQEFPPQLTCRGCKKSVTSTVLGVCDACSSAPFHVEGTPAGICKGCGALTTHHRGSGMFTWGWMCAACWEGSMGGVSSSGTNIQIVTAAHTGGHVDWEYEFAAVNEAIRARDVRTVANGPRLACIMCGVKTTSLVNGVCPWCPRKVKGPDGIYRCPECGCHEGEIHTGPCLGRRLEEKAKQGIYAALADLRSHGADMRVRISRLRWLPKYTPKAESVVVPVSRRRMTFRDFVRQIVSAVLAAI